MKSYPKCQLKRQASLSKALESKHFIRIQNSSKITKQKDFSFNSAFINLLAGPEVIYFILEPIFPMFLMESSPVVPVDINFPELAPVAPESAAAPRCLFK